MRTANFVRFIVALALVVGFAVPSFAGFANVTFFALPGYNHATVTAPGGQTFSNVFGTVDMTVTASGPFSFPSSISADQKTIGSGHTVNSGLPNVFNFAFSQPINLVLQYKTVDSQERLTAVGGSAPLTSQNSGANPTITSIAGGVQITGNGTGISPTGASNGELLFAGATSLRVEHLPLPGRNNKFEFLMVGAQVPEPASFGLIGSLALGLLGLRRRG
jgi:PEP-CTERM motif